MRCGRCNRNGFTDLQSYGGVFVCDTCYDQVNPKTETYKLLDEKSVDRIKLQISEMKQKVNSLEWRLRVNNIIKKSGANSMTVLKT